MRVACGSRVGFVRPTCLTFNAQKYRLTAAFLVNKERERYIEDEFYGKEMQVVTIYSI
jgi:hypothetical protein